LSHGGGVGLVVCSRQYKDGAYGDFHFARGDSDGFYSDKLGWYDFPERLSTLPTDRIRGYDIIEELFITKK